MMECREMKDKIIENLKDAGCDDSFIQRFINIWLSKDTDMQLALLKQHRDTLLQKYHEAARRIDCLDYLILQLQRQKTNGK